MLVWEELADKPIAQCRAIGMLQELKTNPCMCLVSGLQVSCPCCMVCRCLAVIISFALAHSLVVFVILFGIGELALFATQVWPGFS